MFTKIEYFKLEKREQLINKRYYFWRSQDGEFESIVRITPNFIAVIGQEFAGPIPKVRDWELIRRVLESVAKTVSENTRLKIELKECKQKLDAKEKGLKHDTT